MEIDKTLEELGDIAKKWLQTAIDSGTGGTAVQHTASGMTYHMLKEMGVFDSCQKSSTEREAPHDC